MKKDIKFPKVENIAMAIVPEINENNDEIWNVYLINLNDHPIHNVIIASRGYGVIDGYNRVTSQLRHYVEEIPPTSFVKIEPIIEEVFVLNNEYWVSYYIDRQIFDKKYIFLADSIHEEFFTEIPLMNRRGMLIM
ncbi:MAG: hypothetical protein KatS3mg034_1575 [Vicingaceae bacterium]|nr:MAG: hypothetical protein KatS3mg034_1575 [Vicingaceae bacterium]